MMPMDQWTKKTGCTFHPSSNVRLRGRQPATDVQKIYLVPSQLPLRPPREREVEEVASQDQWWNWHAGEHPLRDS